MRSLFPACSARNRTILSCLTAAERKEFANALGKIEQQLNLVQTAKDARAKKDAY